MTYILARIYATFHGPAVFVAGIFLIAFAAGPIGLVVSYVKHLIRGTDVENTFVWSKKYGLVYIVLFVFAALFSLPVTSFYHLIGYQAPITEQSNGRYYYYVEIEELDTDMAVAYIEKESTREYDSYALIELIIDNASFDGNYEPVAPEGTNSYMFDDESEIHYTLTNQEATVPGHIAESGHIGGVDIFFILYGTALIVYNIYYYSKHPSAEE